MPNVNGYPVNVATQTQAVTFGGFKTIEDKQKYERGLIQPSRNESILDQFFEHKKLSKHQGKTISFRKPGRIKPRTEILEEGKIPEPNGFSITEYTTSIQNYGDWIKYSDELAMYSFDNIASVLIEEMGYAFKDFIEGKRYELLKTSKNIWFAGVEKKPAEETMAEYKKAITKNGIVLDDLSKISAFFSRNNVKRGKDNLYVILCAPEVIATLQSLKKSEAGESYTYIELNTQLNNEDVIYRGAEGKALGFVFVSSNSITIDEEGYSECIILGKVNGKWGTTDLGLEGIGKPEVHSNGFGSAGTNDPLAQVASIGWKSVYGGLVTYDEAVMRYIVKTDFNYSELEEANRNGATVTTTFKPGTGTSDAKVEAKDLYNGGSLADAE